MPIRKILRYPDPFLRKPASFVSRESLDRVFDMAQDVESTLVEIDHGAAMAANQVGFDARFFVLNPRKKFDGYDGPTVVVNPAIVNTSKETDVEREGCLSFPGISIPVRRPTGCRVSFLSMEGKPYTLDLQGFIARVFQHEIEHLHGKLFVDHLPVKERIEIINILKKR